MKIGLYQFNPIFKDCQVNLEILCSKSAEIDVEILVFPELSLSGYSFVSKEQTSEMATKCLELCVYEKISQIAIDKNKIIIYGFPEIDGKSIYNSAQLCFPDKKFDRVYRKTHLFFNERFAFDEGNSGFFVINYPEWDINIGTMICYDWRFPEATRSLALLGADLIVCPSNLITNIWTKVMPARAIENKVFLCVANRTGTESANGDVLDFNGLSAIYDINGSTLGMASASLSETIIVDIDPVATRDKSFNSINNIFLDRRTIHYYL